MEICFYIIPAFAKKQDRPVKKRGGLFKFTISSVPEREAEEEAVAEEEAEEAEERRPCREFQPGLRPRRLSVS